MVEESKKTTTEPQDVVVEKETPAESRDQDQDEVETKKTSKKTLTFEEKLQKINEQAERLKAKKKRLMMQHSQQERKERTRRLIQLGGIAEKYIGIMDTEKKRTDFTKMLSLLQSFLQQNKSTSVKELKLAVAIEKVIAAQLDRPLTQADVPALQAFLKEQDDRGKYFSNAMR